MSQAAMPAAPDVPPQADRPDAAALETIAPVRPKPSGWTALWDWFKSPAQQRRWQNVVLVTGTFYNIVVKLPWLLAIVVIAVLLIQGLVQRTTAIEPISVPKALAERGYTPEVAAQRLRDALERFALTASKFISGPVVALRGELPSVVVPTVGLSLEAVMSSIRTFLGSSRRRSISGEFIVKEDLLWLRLRMDGRELYSSLNGVHLERPDQLLDEAVPKILDVIKPIFVAAWHMKENREKAFVMAKEIIDRLPETDENVAWSYSLLAIVHYDRKEHAKAIEAQKKGIQLNSRVAAAAVIHFNLGNMLTAHNMNDEAIAAFREAIRLDPKDAYAYYELGASLHKKEKNDEAIAAFREAIRLDPSFPYAHDYLGVILMKQGKTDEAIAEFREAIRVDPSNASARSSLDNILRNVPGTRNNANENNSPARQ